MSQTYVERVIGRLATDEALRGKFTRDPHGVLTELMGRGMELNECEQWSLVQLDPKELARFAGTISPRLQKADPQGGAE